MFAKILLPLFALAAAVTATVNNEVQFAAAARSSQHFQEGWYNVRNVKSGKYLTPARQRGKNNLIMANKGRIYLKPIGKFTQLLDAGKKHGVSSQFSYSKGCKSQTGGGCNDVAVMYAYDSHEFTVNTDKQNWIAIPVSGRPSSSSHASKPKPKTRKPSKSTKKNSKKTSTRRCTDSATYVNRHPEMARGPHAKHPECAYLLKKSRSHRVKRAIEERAAAVTVMFMPCNHGQDMTSRALSGTTKVGYDNYMGVEIVPQNKRDANQWWSVTRA